MAPTIRTCSVIALLAAASAAPVAASRPSLSPLGQYAVARIADSDGEEAIATRAYGLALSGDTTSVQVAARAYRQAIDAGDYPLALRAARAIAAAGLPMRGDMLLLAVSDATKRRDFKGALAISQKLEEDSAFGFLAPVVQSWLQWASHAENPLAPLEARARDTLTGAYARDHRALLLIALGRNEEGLAAVRSLATQDSRGLALRLAGAAMLADRKDRDRALKLLDGQAPSIRAARALVEAGKPLPFAISSPEEAFAFLYMRVAGDLLRENASAAGVVLARSAAFADPASDFARLTLAQALSLSARDADALAELDRVAPSSVVASAASEIRGAVLERSERFDEALALVDAALVRSPGDAALLARKGQLLSRLNRFPEAAAELKRAIDAAREGDGIATSWTMWVLYGSALDRAGDWPGAKAAFKRAVELAPDDAGALNHLGYSMLERGDEPAEALKILQKANSLRPGDAAITDSLAWALHRNGKPAEALALLETALTADPNEPVIGEHLGDVYWALGRRFEARYAWRAALVLNEDKAAITRLEGKIANGIK